MTMQRALKFSLAIHLITLFLIGGFPKGCSRGGSGDSDSSEHTQEDNHKEDKKEEIIEKPIDQPTEITLIEETKEQAEKRIEKARRKEIAECTPFFGGIGVVFNDRDGTIGQVYKYYPGYDAGLRAGDRFVSPPVGQIKGEIGTSVTITLERGTELYTVTIIRGRICTKDATPPKLPGDEP